MKIFETHAHLDFRNFDKDRQQLITQCKKKGIDRIINIGIDRETSLNSIKMANKYDTVYASVGYHPHDAKDYSKDKIIDLLNKEKVVAVGEIGLDYYRNKSPKEIQKKAFEEQIKLALKANLPIIVHDRDAHEDCLNILGKYNPEKVVFHCFAGNEKIAERIIDKNWMISFTGTVTFKNSKMDNVVRMVPKENFFVETDSPYLTPHPHRGKRNSPL